MKNKISIWWLLVLAIVFFALMKQCEGEPSIKTETKTEIKIIRDTITKVEIKEVPKTVYVEKIKNIKGKDSIIYKDKPSETTTTANQYETKLKSNKATADLKITTTGELLDVQGLITYPEIKETKTTTITRDASGFYIYAKMPISSQITTPELGAMIQIKNKIIIGIGGQYNSINNSVNAVATLGIKL